MKDYNKYLEYLPDPDDGLNRYRRKTIQLMNETQAYTTFALVFDELNINKGNFYKYLKAKGEYTYKGEKKTTRVLSKEKIESFNRKLEQIKEENKDE